ncbi:glycoside hydrolase family 15 protein [bacterium]|nr:glycoside hydrolase family 15 protein [bacterium]
MSSYPISLGRLPAAGWVRVMFEEGELSFAFGAPGIEPRWTSSAKEGLGTAYHTSCRLWFTLSHGIVNEIYYPHVDQPNTRDFEFLVSDGEHFCHEEKRDLRHELEYPDRNCPYYRLTNTDPFGRYRIIKDVLTDPHRSVLIVNTRLDVIDEALRGKLHLYALLAPHLARFGKNNTGWHTEISGLKVLCAKRDGYYLVMGCSSGFVKRSAGYVGSSDGWQDLMRHRKMEWGFTDAPDGNIALTGEIDLRRGNEAMVAIAIGGGYQSTVTKLMQTMADPFEAHRDGFVRQWQRTVANHPSTFTECTEHTADGGHLYRLSRFVLLSHEDKVFQGALVASMSIPWGETRGDNDVGGYHLVWTRDLVQSATALLAGGQAGTAQRALIWLAAIQHPDGAFPQNCWIDGTAFWSNFQLDEIAYPILLAWRLHVENAMPPLFEPCVMVMTAVEYLILHCPVTAQERWEENAGYSPSTLATVIASLVCAGEFSRLRGDTETADFILAYADWLAAHLEEWTVTIHGELVPGKPRHYIRINPTDPWNPDPHADPNTTMIQVTNGGGLHPARNVVSGDFLHLVRLGIRDAHDPVVLDSVDVIDRVLKRDLPDGPCWRRYNHDGYGQKADGSACDEDGGVGRSWPLLTGERGHYELAAGRDPFPLITAMEKFANEGGMLSEQLWDADDVPAREMFRGKPTGAAMPLCWAHAEYIKLVRSRGDGVCYDRVDPAFERYVANPVPSRYEMWTFRHPIRRMPRGKMLRIIVGAEARVVWSADGWASVNQTKTTAMSSLHLEYVDLPTDRLAAGSTIEFTFFWEQAQRWEGRNFEISIQ